jgi:NAD(P)-dependent dehydrogenase (short-subunit alcohol dehydrogenase family)
MPDPEKSAVANYANPTNLEGRGFVVFGAGQGIGRQSAIALGQSGARVLCVDRDRALANAVAEEVKGEAIDVDVTRREGVETVFAKAAAVFGDSLAGLVDIVGIADARKLVDIDDASWDRNFDIVLRHAYLAIQVGARHMPNGGSMVFVSSMAGVLSIENQTAYGTAKAALNHLVHCMGRELGPRGIRVNAVAPGFVRTPRLLKAMSEATWKKLDAGVPLGRAADPSDIASAILFLASDMARHVTGVVLPVDGGLSTVAAVPLLPIGSAAPKAAS